MDKENLRDWVLENLYNNRGGMIAARMKRWSSNHPYWVEKHFPDVFVDIQELEGRTFREKVFLLVSRQNIPKCRKVGCDNEVEFIDPKTGYFDFCSYDCCNNDEELNKSRVSNHDYEQSVEKSKETYRKKYGVDWVFQVEEVREKIQETCIERYGVPNPGMVEEFEEKQKETNRERYGCNKPLQNEKIYQKALKNGAGRSKTKWIGDIWYQGEYERIFLENALGENKPIKRGSMFIYFDVFGVERKYFPDFVIDNNLYEIKSIWTWDNLGRNKLLRIKNKLKLRTAKRNGYNVFLVIEGITFPYKQFIKMKVINVERWRI